jgi:hypothetical protein
MSTTLKLSIGIILLFASAAGPDTFSQQKSVGWQNTPIVDSCFTVRGRLSCWNGNPSLRIWIIGTKRMLGVREGSPMPDTLQNLIKTFDTEVFGRFLVCPLTKYKPGVMQTVRILSVQNPVARQRRNN